MIFEMKTRTSRRHALPLAAGLILTFLVPRATVAQDRSSSKPHEFDNLETSVRGGLQQSLQAAFPDSFREGVDIFWGPGDGWVSPEVFNWWASRVDPRGLNQDAATRMFSRISGRSPVFSIPRRRQICAVVGASRNLLGSRYGNLIDAHNVVFRVNRAPTADFHRDVGEKTTHHITWPTDFGKGMADRRAYLLLNPMTVATENLFDWIVSLVEDSLRWDPGRVRIIHPEFVKYIYEDWMDERGQFPSTGFIALMIAVHVCDDVDVFGFGADADGRWDRYYEDDPAVPTGLHPAEFEGEFRREMEDKGILKVFLGNRSESGVEFFDFELDESERED